MELKGNSIDHLAFFIHKLQNNEPFGIIRPGDGEYGVIKDEQIATSDNWQYKPGGSLSRDLNDALKTTLPNLYIGISCQGCSEEIYNTMKALITCPVEQITYANIFCNRNWKLFVNYLKTREFVYIGPGTTITPDFKVLRRYGIHEKLVELWDTIRDDFLHDLDDFISSISNTIICFSAGPISKVLIPRYMRMFPSNTYLDVGSALDSFMKGGSNRQYLNDTQYYARQVCSFEGEHHRFYNQQDLPQLVSEHPDLAVLAGPEPAPTPVQQQQQDTIADLTVVLNMYKRPHTLDKQIAAIRAQTCKPRSIILWVNAADNISIPNNILNDPQIHIIHSNKNTGVWGRFTASILAQTTYVCVFDDDTIPGRRWFENCFRTMNEREGLLGTVGIRFKPGTDYMNSSHRIGWPGPNEKTEEVDIVGHSWFFKREWLAHLFQTIPKWPDYFCAGEDIAFSAGLQKVGIPTLVPPHPPGQLEWYGSLPESAWQYGTESVGISMDAAQYQKFNVCLRDLISKGFTTIANRAKAAALLRLKAVK